MEVLRYLRNFVSDCSRIIEYGANLQNPVRAQLVLQLQEMCSRCEAAYSSVRSELRPIKESYRKRLQLVTALRTFSHNPIIRENFKPEKLCGEADIILDKLDNNLDSLKYSIQLRKIRSLRRGMRQFQDYDGAIYASFDDFVRSLDTLAAELDDPLLKGDALRERIQNVRSVIEDFEDELSKTVREVLTAKNRLLH